MKTETRVQTTEAITPGSLALFLAYAKDAGNWAGQPLVGGNVEHGLKENGHLTHLKKLGLLVTEPDLDNKRCEWIIFTDAGKALATEHGINL